MASAAVGRLTPKGNNMMSGAPTIANVLSLYCL